jgi:DNA-binding transcriptional regulator YhcF (GntR family)
MWDFTLNRRAALPLRDQLALQFDLKILQGEVVIGQKLPSVRSLARRLQIDSNTVAAVYRQLKTDGKLETSRGSGAFASNGMPSMDELLDPEATLRYTLHAMLRSGRSAAEIKETVSRWLDTSPPGEIAVIDPVRETAELLAVEIRQHLGVRVVAHTLLEAAHELPQQRHVLPVALPFHVRRLASWECFRGGRKVLPLRLARPDYAVVNSLPPESFILVVSHSPEVLPYVSMLLQCFGGDRWMTQCFIESDQAAWHRIVPIADLAIVDARSSAAVRRVFPRRLQQLRLIARSTLDELRQALRLPGFWLDAGTSAGLIPACARRPAPNLANLTHSSEL